VLANSSFIDFSCLSPVVPNILVEHEILSNCNLALLTENFLCFHILKEKGGVVVSWWFITSCSAQVAFLVEHFWGKLQHHR